ncbi:MAG: DUF4159 domain-containing protein [Sandaracinaceae bacterium]|nr:DUF4159 domain-containing protein [Sandaracinaceae bacterium]
MKRTKKLCPVFLAIFFAYAFCIPLFDSQQAKAIEEGGVRLQQLAPFEARPHALRRLAWEIRRRTSVDTHPEPRKVHLSDPALFDSLFLYWPGEGPFEPLPSKEISQLRRFLTLGGLLLVDDAKGDGVFANSVRRELAKVFPQSKFEHISNRHTLYHSYYILDRPVGRIEGPPQLEAIFIDGRLAVILSVHDLGGAWARDPVGGWLYPVEPGGETQREMAIRLGVNIVLYALCLDYKDDQVHAPFIMRRRRGQP